MRSMDDIDAYFLHYAISQALLLNSELFASSENDSKAPSRSSLRCVLSYRFDTLNEKKLSEKKSPK